MAMVSSTLNCQLFHRVFPAAAGVNTSSVGQLLQPCQLLSRQFDFGSLGSLNDVALLRGSDDGRGTFGYGSGYAYLRARGTVLLANVRHLVGQCLQLWQHGVVLLAAVTFCGQRVLLIILARECALL